MTDDESAHTNSARGVYGMSVASEMSGLDPQTLRLYDQRGLLTPARTVGGTRRYSDDDLHRLRRITALVGDGVNLTGVAMVLALQDSNTRLQDEVSRLRRDNSHRNPGRNV
jgi:MerR family transcriptional regulator, heat shock protein HspR